MFFNVMADDEDVCPYCGTEINGWQSKSDRDGTHDVWGGCCPRHNHPLPTLLKEEVENYYHICANKDCGKWVEYKVDVTVTHTLIDQEGNEVPTPHPLNR